MPPKKLPGVLKDPWRSAVPAPPKQSVRAKAVDAPPPAMPEGEESSESFSEPQYATIELKGYGGITVQGTKQLPIAAAQLLSFCVDNLTDIESVLLDFGVIVTKLAPSKLTTPFYIQRRDGWTLAIPQAETRDAGCLQIIQAMLKLYAEPKIRQKMTQHHLRPYRV